MHERMTDQEEKEMLKAWWNNYGKSILIAIVLGVGIGYGWRYYKAHKLQEKADASVLYAQLIEAKPDQYKDFLPMAKALKNKYSSTVYASMAAAWMAKVDVSKKDYSAAITQMQYAVNHTSDLKLAPVFKIRLARLYFQVGKAQQAKATLNGIQSQAYIEQVQQLLAEHA